MSGLARLNAVRFEGYMAAQDKMEDSIERAEKQHQKGIDESHRQALIEIENNREAREKQSFFTGLFAVVLGPLIGSAVGNAIGEAVNEGDQADAQAAKRQVAIADRVVEDSWEAVKDQQENLADVQGQAEAIRKASQELDEIGWAGTQS